MISRSTFSKGNGEWQNVSVSLALCAAWWLQGARRHGCGQWSCPQRGGHCGLRQMSRRRMRCCMGKRLTSLPMRATKGRASGSRSNDVILTRTGRSRCARVSANGLTRPGHARRSWTRSRPSRPAFARGAHIFAVMNCVFHDTKVRYRGLKKHAAQITTLLMLANLWMVRRRLLQTTTGSVRAKSAPRGQSFPSGAENAPASRINGLQTPPKRYQTPLCKTQTPSRRLYRSCSEVPRR